MPLVASIVPQNAKNLFCVYLDNGFRLDIDVYSFSKLNLKVGQNLSDSDVLKILELIEFQKTLDRLINFATIRPRSIKEISLWLDRKKVPEKIRLELFDKLKSLKLIDDFKFACWWVKQRNAFNPKPISVLKFELLQKGVDKKVIQKVLAKTTVNERENAINILARKINKFSKYSGMAKFNKMVTYLLRKGYSIENARHAANHVNKQVLT
ncbi:MAG: RecX family transcriptional regulator [Patescibacteria group bacterium]|nr:RecX family transcriptional regulator [Patescibacteria group bacterium]